MSYRDEKIAGALKELAAEFVERVSNHRSLITVTGIRMSPDNKEAAILVTVFPDDKEKPAIDFLKRQRSELKSYVKNKSRIGLIPFFDFEIDQGEKNRQRIDELIHEDERKHGIDNRP